MTILVPQAVYLLCGVTSILCALVLLRSYLRGRDRLLLWSTLCFAGLAGNNVLLFVDLVIAPQYDFSLYRAIVGLVAIGTILFGLIWEIK